MTRRKKGKENVARRDNLSKMILGVFRKDSQNTLNYKQIAAKLGISDASGRNQIIRKLAKLAAMEKLQEVSKGKFQLKENKNYFQGVVDMTSKGDAYVVVDGLDDDIYIPKKNMNKALHGDLVQAYVFKRKKSGKYEGEIVQVVERKKTEFVGILNLHENFGFVSMQDPKMYTDIFIPKERTKNAKDGIMVLVEIVDWPEKADSPIGQVKEILGVPGEHETEMHAILAQYGLPYEFPKEVEKYADQLDTSIEPKEIKKRRDMREVLTFTIDPKDAKDFDDALSFRKLENGNFEIGVHIADVSHYVKPGTILDDEAYERATSVYLVDRVVPMLPEVLSNNACSLRPHEEKYTFSAVFEITKNAELKGEWFGRTVTYSDARFSYEEAQHIIETEKGHIPDEIAVSGENYEVNEAIVESIQIMDDLAKKMRARRMQHGAISFDTVEVKFNLDENNDPVGVYFKTSKDANKLIEEYMLLANKKVSEFIGRQNPEKTFVYRCHDEPKEDRLTTLQTVIEKFGYKINLKNKKTIASSLNTLLTEVVGKKEQNLVDTLTIRTMSKAYYSTKNIGHYGLAFDYYSHFTSPIRRYPDVMAHRLLQRYLDKQASADQEDYEEKCKHSSEMENLATNAERDSTKYMQIKFMQDHKNEQFLGVISGVTDFGIFVEIIQNKCEGMVRLRDIEEDHFDFDEEHYAIVGRKTGKMYQLGDEVYITVKNADLVKRQMDFNLIGSRLDVEY
ncbi:MAG TPA: ribonuclease R [Flavobacteriaceae bacterium]|nr:ribonuclease R [Flavobacteriaceae bacterium]